MITPANVNNTLQLVKFAENYKVSEITSKNFLDKDLEQKFVVKLVTKTLY